MQERITQWTEYQQTWFLWGPSLETSYWFIQGPLMMFQPDATKTTFIGSKLEQMLLAITLICSRTSAGNCPSMGTASSPWILSVCSYFYVLKAPTEQGELREPGQFAFRRKAVPACLMLLQGLFQSPSAL